MKRVNAFFKECPVSGIGSKQNINADLTRTTLHLILGTKNPAPKKALVYALKLSSTHS
ncbi:hypothetical protein ASZ90_018520 [hydrocarbon metagenome]|uniref:Uncharacterized protein n=1 Tax=hydrocarbon metagenome TaxID=938273 RepID=A0A0W8E5X7_9ZZZZ